MHAEAIPAVFAEEESQDGFIIVLKYSESNLIKLQKEDPVISEVIGLMESGTDLPANYSTNSPELRLMLREWKRLKLKSGLVYRV